MVMGNSVVGAKVLSRNEGKFIGEVEDLLFVPGEQRIGGLLLKQKGLFGSDKVIPMHQVREIGKDAVVVDSEAVLENVEDLVETEVKDVVDDSVYLAGVSVMTEKGVKVGVVDDIYFDEKTGKVEGVAVAENGIAKVTRGVREVPMESVVTVGEDALIVNEAATLAWEKSEPTGGVAKAFQDTVGEAKKEAKALKDKTEQHVEAIAHDPRTVEASEVVKEKGVRLRNQVERSMEQAAETMQEKINEPKTKHTLQQVTRKLKEAKSKTELTALNARLKAEEVVE